jgi:hypothetical protein
MNAVILAPSEVVILSERCESKTLRLLFANVGKELPGQPTRA